MTLPAWLSLRPEGRPLWDRLSASYDRQLWLERAAVRAALDLLAPRSEERLLDVGTGTGAVLRQLAARDVRPREAVGVDPSAAMLAQVPALPAGWSVREGDARALPFADERFDVAVASYLLHVLAAADVPAVLAELRRVLRVDGRLVTVTPAVPSRGVARAVALALDRLARHGSERLCGLRSLDPRPALARAGFALVRARWTTRGYPSLCVLARRQAVVADARSP
ncbi:MAG TPA: class I SAM-dependent methyltransferase [Solirubrobacteraceae bacterium]|nr:class I SAM-dependent methyltransferase [Solirubrobacteraceae bacterium]